MGSYNRAEVITKNVTKTYQKASDQLEKAINKPSCRLISPTKNELGKISKIILEQINQETLKKTEVNQWKNTSKVIKWFNNTENKKDCSFIQFDIKEFYPSITEEILEQAISFAKSLTDIDDHKIRTIKHCRKSVLFHNSVAWKKKTKASCFGVTINSYDGLEVCELVGTFILSGLGSIIGKKNTGLYRDDGLVVLRNMNAWGIDKIRKIIIKMFKDIGFNLK